MKKKVNPRRVPVSAAAADARAGHRAVLSTAAIFLTVLRDKEGYGTEGLRRVWDAVESLSDGIAKGYVNVKDLQTALREEAGIILE